MIIDYVFSTIDPRVLCFLLGLAVGMFLELILVLIIEKIGGKNDKSGHKTNKKEN